MQVLADTQFATTWTGMFLIPLLVALSAAAIVGAIVGTVKILRTLEKVTSRLDAQDVVAREMAAELRPNGGGSLKDKVNQTADAVGNLAEELRKHLEDSAYKRGQLDKFMEFQQPAQPARRAPRVKAA